MSFRFARGPFYITKKKREKKRKKEKECKKHKFLGTKRKGKDCH